MQQHPRSAPTTSWEHSLPHPIAVTARMLFYIPRGEEGQVISVSNQSRKYTHRWMERWLDGRGDRQVHRQIGGWTDDQTSDIPRAWSAFLSLSTAETWGLDQSLMGGASWALRDVDQHPCSPPCHTPGACLPTPHHNNCLQASANVHQEIKSPHFGWCSWRRTHLPG